MGFQSRKRNYKSIRERKKIHGRNIRVIFTFVAIASIIWIYRERFQIIDWIKTWFY
jgi:hypothetical protein